MSVGGGGEWEEGTRGGEWIKHNEAISSALSLQICSSIPNEDKVRHLIPPVTGKKSYTLRQCHPHVSVHTDPDRHSAKFASLQRL